MVYSGIVKIRKEAEGSKSEGNYAYLATAQEEYRLFRPGMFPVDDDFFSPFKEKKVEIEGTVTDCWLSVEAISELPGDDIALDNGVEGNTGSEDNCNKGENNEKDM